MSGLCPYCGKVHGATTLNSCQSIENELALETRKLITLNQQVQAKFVTVIAQVKDLDIKTQLTQIVKQCSDMGSSVTSIQRIVENTKIDQSNQIKDLSNQIAKLNEEIAHKDASIAKVKSAAKGKTKLQITIEQLQNNLQEAQNTINQKDQEITTLKARVDKIKRKARKMKHDVVQQSLQQNTASCENFNDQISSLNARFEAMQNDNRRLDDRNTELEALCKHLQAKVNESNETIEELEKTIEGLKARRGKLFDEKKFELLNPFEGEMKIKFDRFKEMTQFEADQRAQLIINEAARELKVQGNDLQHYTEAAEKAEKRIHELEEAKEEGNIYLQGLLTQLKQLEKNENMFAEDAIATPDEEFLKYIKSAMPPDFIMLDDAEAVITNLISKNDNVSKLVAGLLLTNHKLSQQLKRAGLSIKERDHLIKQVQKAGVKDMREVPEYIDKLRTQRRNYLGICKQLDGQINELIGNLSCTKEEAAQVAARSKKLKTALDSMKQQHEQVEVERDRLSATVESLEAQLNACKKSSDGYKSLIKQLKADLELKSNQYIDAQDEIRKLRNDLNDQIEENAHLDIDLRANRELMRAEFEKAQNRVAAAEKKASKKVQELQKQHQQDMTNVAQNAKKLKATSYEVVDATYAQISELKKVLHEVVNKLEDCRREKKTLKSENDRLEKKLKDTLRRLKETEENASRNEERVRFETKKKMLEKQTKIHEEEAQKAMAAVKDQQRICNMIASELGPSYGVDKYDVGDYEGLLQFVRRVRDDLKKLRVFQRDALRH